VVHLESVASHIPPKWQGSHTSGGAARTDTPFISPPRYGFHPRSARCGFTPWSARCDLAPWFARCGFRASICSDSDSSAHRCHQAAASLSRLPRLSARCCPAAASATAAAIAIAPRKRKQSTDISELGVGQSERGHLAEAEPTAPAARSEAAGFPGRPVRDAHSAEWELMSALSLTRSVRGDRFQMHHYPLQARGPA